MNECEIDNGGCIANCTNNLALPYECTCGTDTNCTGIILIVMKYDKNISYFFSYFECIFIILRMIIGIGKCAVNNGDCDTLTTCTDYGNGTLVCGPCPNGYGGDGKTGCFGTSFLSFLFNSFISISIILLVFFIFLLFVRLFISNRLRLLC